MIYYFLFGKNPTDQFENDEPVIIKPGEGQLFTWNSEDTPISLLNAYDGWDGLSLLNETEYNKIKSENK